MIKRTLTILFLFVSMLQGEVINIEENKNIYDLLPSSQIYIDKTRKLTIDDITTKNIKFENNHKSILGYGYSPDFDVWIKFTLKNNSDKTIHKILEYGNSMTTDVIFYDAANNTKIKEGHLNISFPRNSINPIFKVMVNPHETKTYYIKASSYITTLIVKLTLYNNDDFYSKEMKHQAVLFLFFGAMIVLAIYNLFIYFFSKDISYLYYVLYIIGITIHHLMYVGIASIYILSHEQLLVVHHYASLLVIFPAVSLALFTKYFLDTKKYRLINKILNIFLYLVLLNLIVFLLSDYFNHYRNLLPVILLIYLFLITIYFVWKKNRQAYFILFGWLVFVSMGTLMYLSSLGLLNISIAFPYIVELSLITEIVIFSIALSDKINRLEKEKNNVNKELIIHKKTQNKKLKMQVEKKTKDLNISLEEKNLLLQELNHRVKNNMQIIISLIRLQTNDIDDIKIKSLFLTTQNRLNVMNQLHELLYQKDDIAYINAYDYFSTLIDGLQETYTKDIKVNYTIDTDIQTEQAISCGIILNELVTNSLKYAFTKDNINDKHINIFLYKQRDTYIMVVKDNGIGYDKENITKSFGLNLVNTLVSSKLQGTIISDTKNKVEVTIKWREENE